jgi:peptidoglycan/xylan/chitin deacetylase (PgdA/CDA1 family)
MLTRHFSDHYGIHMTVRALWAMTFALFLSLAPLAAAEGETDSDRGATILCYHIVESPQDPRMEISRETFRQQMRYLEMTGYTVVPLRDVYDYASGARSTLPKNAVAITIDDGWRSTYTEVFPEMKRLHFPFTVFLYPQIIGKTAHAMTWKQVKEMAEAGVDIQSHSLSHPYLTHRYHPEFDDKQYAEWLQRELRDSKKILERATGRPVVFLAYPYGEYDHKLTRAVARAGYEGGLTCETGSVKSGSNPMRMKRVAIDKRMDFATFRHLLGAGSMRIEDMTPHPGQIIAAAEPVVTVSAKIPNPGSLDPNSVGIALLSIAGSVPYAYDPRNGSITLTINALTGTLQRALVWATDVKSGRRVEASWTFRLPNECPPIEPLPLLSADPAALDGGLPSTARGGEPAGEARLQFHRSPKQ